MLIIKSMADFENYIKLDAESAMDQKVPLLFLSFPSAKDPNWKLHSGRENKSTMALVTISKWEASLAPHLAGPGVLVLKIRLKQSWFPWVAIFERRE